MGAISANKQVEINSNLIGSPLSACWGFNLRGVFDIVSFRRVWLSFKPSHLGIKIRTSQLMSEIQLGVWEFPQRIKKQFV